MSKIDDIRYYVEHGKDQVDNITQQMEDYAKILQAHRPQAPASISDAWHKAARLISWASEIIEEVSVDLREVGDAYRGGIIKNGDEITAAWEGLMDVYNQLVHLRNRYADRVRDLMITD